VPATMTSDIGGADQKSTLDVKDSKCILNQSLRELVLIIRLSLVYGIKTIQFLIQLYLAKIELNKELHIKLVHMLISQWV